MKRVFLRLCDALLLFHFAARLRSPRLTVLCYHGFEVEHECAFRPQLFISRKTFEERLAYLKRGGFSLLSLADAVDRLRNGSLPARAVVLTIDDGFKSTASVALPLLRKYGVPATVYVTTYYVEKQVPIFRLAVQYIFWSLQRSELTSAQVSAISQVVPSLKFNATVEAAQWSIIRFGEALPSEESRQRLLQSLGAALSVDLTALVRDGLVSLMSPEEITLLAAEGIDVQLHTHRHRFPLHDRDAAVREIEENRERLSKMIGKVPMHFCYPSGIFDERQWPWLEAIGVLSATTCLAGTNDEATHKFALKRFLDSESVSFEEFKAELCGFNEITRQIRAFLVGSRQRESRLEPLN